MYFSVYVVNIYLNIGCNKLLFLQDFEQLLTKLPPFDIIIEMGTSVNDCMIAVSEKELILKVKY